MMTDVIDKIDRIFAEERAPRPPLKCPHCERDWHPEPLTANVANMWANHYFDPDYDPAADTSRIVCVGAHYHGPNHNPRPRWAFPNDPLQDKSGFAAGGLITMELSGVSQAWANTLEKFKAVVASIDLAPLTLNLWHPGDAETKFLIPHYGHVVIGGKPAAWAKAWTNEWCTSFTLDEWTPAETWPDFKLLPWMHYLRIDPLACSVHARNPWIYPADRAAVAGLMHLIRSEVRAQERIPLPPQQPIDFSRYITAIEKSTTYPKGKTHEGQRIPHRSPCRARRRMDTRRMAKRKR